MITEVTHISGSYAWDTNLTPAAPATITVPSTDADGTYSISWAASGSATGYTLQEATAANFSDAAGIYTGALLTKTVTGNTDGTYYYRVLATNALGDSSYTEGANGCVVSVPVVRVSPDLGWADIGRMLNPTYNEMAISIPFSALTSTQDTVKAYVSHNYPVINLSGNAYTISTTYVRRLRADGKKYYYLDVAAGVEGTLRTFKLLLVPGATK